MYMYIYIYFLMPVILDYRLIVTLYISLTNS